VASEPRRAHQRHLPRGPSDGKAADRPEAFLSVSLRSRGLVVHGAVAVDQYPSCKE
jgi:hypothetical protein